MDAEIEATIADCSTRRWWEPAFEGDERTLAAWAKHITGVPTIAVGSVTLGLDPKSPGGRRWANTAPEQLANLERALDDGDFDLVAVGRAMLSNPDWAACVQAGRASELRPFSKEHLAALS